MAGRRPGDRTVVGMAQPYVDVTVDGAIATVTLNHTEKRNALALDVMLELTQVLREIAQTDALGVILAANGPVFSAGHNFGDMLDAELPDAQHLLQVCTDMMNTVQQIPQVVIARVHALATAAGCQLVASCDLAVAASSAGFALPGGKGGLFCHTPLVAVARQRDDSAPHASARADPVGNFRLDGLHDHVELIGRLEDGVIGHLLRGGDEDLLVL